MGHVVEPQKNVPIAQEADVVVAGGGVSGIIAAIAAARAGAKTVLVDRFGAPGGNIGPGMFVGGSLTGWPGRSIDGGICGIAREFIETHGAHGGGAVPPFSAGHYMRDSHVASYVATKMMAESGVELMLSAYAADPILDGKRVAGLYVENKSGRQAIPAAVVIDATGEADVARRAGGPVNYPDPEIKERGRTMGIQLVVGGVDWDRHDAPDPKQWLKRYVEIVDKATEEGEFAPTQEVPGLCTLRGFEYRPSGSRSAGTATGYVGVDWPDNLNQGDGAHISRMEVEMRNRCFETAAFWKKHVPGFEDSYLLNIAPFLGSRGGPAIDGEVTLTQEDIDAERKFDDVIFIFVNRRADPPGRMDAPYRSLLPREIDGLLACGRSAARRPGSLMRGRAMMMLGGQVAGTAAALAIQGGVAPKELDVRTLQLALLDAGYYLGDRSRLKELHLV